MPTDLKKAKRALAKAQKALAVIEQATRTKPGAARGGATAAAAMPPKNAKTVRAMAQLEDAYADFSTAIGAAGKVTAAATAQAPLSDFFEGVAQGLVTAQTALDERSRGYLASIAGKPYLMPSIFRIPKLSASLKFAVQDATSSSVNLIFYRDETTQTTQNQQSIEFDIVSAPVSPGSTPAPFSVAALIDPSARGAVFDQLLGSLPADSPLRRDRDRVLLLAIDSLQRFYALYAEAGRGALGFWYIQLGPPPVVSEIRAFGTAGDAGIEALRALVAAQGDAQKALLAQLG